MLLLLVAAAGVLPLVLLVDDELLDLLSLLVLDFVELSLVLELSVLLVSSLVLELSLLFSLPFDPDFRA